MRRIWLEIGLRALALVLIAGFAIHADGGKKSNDWTAYAKTVNEAIDNLEQQNKLLLQNQESMVEAIEDQADTIDRLENRINILEQRFNGTATFTVPNLPSQPLLWYTTPELLPYTVWPSVNCTGVGSSLVCTQLLQSPYSTVTITD